MQRLLYLDILRIFAIFAVVLLHQSAGIARLITHDDWIVNSFAFAVSHFGVPLFIMISGALLLNRKENVNIGAFYKKTFIKIVIPLFFWSVIYYIYRTGWSDLSFEIFLTKFFADKISGHFWFMYMILGIYLSFPLIHAALSQMDDRSLLYMLAIWLLISLVAPMTSYLLHIKLAVKSFVFTTYLGYFIWGYYLNRVAISCNKMIFAVAGFIIGITIATLGTQHLSTDAGKLIGIFWHNNSITIFLIASSIFLMVKHFSANVTIENTRLKNFIISLSLSSYGIYFIHIIFLNQYNKWVKIDSPYQSLLLHTIAILLTSYIFVLIIKRIPFIGQYLVGTSATMKYSTQPSLTTAS